MKQRDKRMFTSLIIAALTAAMFSAFIKPSLASEDEWTYNSNLTKALGKWDRRIWHWGYLSGDTVPADPDSNNYVKWAADGKVDLPVQDSPYDNFWTAANLDQGTERSSLPAAYQPPLQKVASCDTMILEADVENCHGSDHVDPQDFIGIKFDVWAVVDQEEGTKLMVEMYFLRAGANLVWQREYCHQTFQGSDTWNYLVALDHPDFYGIHANETKYGADSAKWVIDVKWFLKRGVEAAQSKGAAGLYFDWVKLSKVSFTLEAGATVSMQYPKCWATIHQLKVTYTGQFLYIPGMNGGYTTPYIMYHTYCFATGEDACITAVCTAENWRLLYWIVDGHRVEKNPYSNSIIITMNTGHSVHAIFGSGTGGGGGSGDYYLEGNNTEP